MSERNDKGEQDEQDEQDIKRWTAKRRAALIVELLSSNITIVDGHTTAQQRQAPPSSAWISLTYTIPCRAVGTEGGLTSRGHYN
jgi:hypothetical protein